MSNNNIVDASDSPKTISLNGNVQQGTFSPLVAASYSYKFKSGESSISFDASNVDMSADFTLEFWKFRKLSDDPIIFNIKLNSTNGFTIVEGNTENRLHYMGSSNVSSITSTISVPTVKDWDHYAIVRSSGSISVYLNGVAFSSVVTSSDNFNSSSIKVGSSGAVGFADGYISDLRISSSALYTETFDVPTSPLFFQADTDLLTAKRPQLIGEKYLSDSNVGTSLSTTVDGVVQSSRKAPYDIPLYNADSAGGSVYIGTGSDRIDVTAGSIDLSGDFTIEAWIRPESVDSGQSIIFDNRESSSDTSGIHLGINLSSLMIGSNDEIISENGTSKYMECWNHIAVVRSSGSIKSYVNGSQIGDTISTASDLTKDTFYIGNSPLGSNFIGYISDFRIVSSAVYTSNFAPSRTMLTNIPGTQLRLPFNGAVIIDRTGGNMVKVEGDVSHSVDDTPFASGTGSIGFDGDGDYMVIEEPDIALGHEFTVEAMIKPENVFGIYDLTPDLENNQVLFLDATDTSSATSASWTNVTESTLVTSPEVVAYGFSNVTFINDGSGNQIGYTLGSTSAVTISTYPNLGSHSGNHPELTGFTGQSNTEFTISGWFLTNTSVLSTTNGEIGQGFTGDDLVNTGVAAIGFNNGYPEFIAKQGFAWSRATAASPISDGDWHHVVWSFNNGQITMYIDGVQSGADQPAMFDGGIFKLDYLGRISSSSYTGSVAGLRLFTTALTASDVEIVHDADAPTYNRNPLRTSGGSGPQQLVQFSNGSGMMLLGNNLIFNDGTSDIITSSGTVSSGTWQHVAVSRDANNDTRMFIGGSQVGSVSSSSVIGSSGDVFIASDINGINGFAGNMTDIRVTKNAVYTANFDAPTESYSIDATPK